MSYLYNLDASYCSTIPGPEDPKEEEPYYVRRC